MQTATNPAYSTPQLPHDLFREILEHLKHDKLTLCAVSLSSTMLRQEAQNIIFRDVTTLPTETRHINFLLTIATSPSRLALHVRAYTNERVYMTRELSDIIHKALLAMSNLKYLRMYYMGRTELESAAVLRGCTFKLERFQWLCDASEAPELFETFLPQQDRLQRISLQFDRVAALQSIRPAGSTISLCPQLVSLVADWDVINILLPGHKITTLTVLDTYTRPSTNIDTNILAPALKHISTLSYPFYFQHDEVPPPERILSYCSSLEVLELGRFDEEEIFVALPKLPSLRAIVLSRDLLSERPLQQEQATELVRRLFDNSSENLQNIYVRNTIVTYERYLRSGGSGAAVSRVTRREARISFPGMG